MPEARLNIVFAGLSHTIGGGWRWRYVGIEGEERMK
jgi:hypothetical protein